MTSTWPRYLVITLSGIVGLSLLSAPGHRMVRRYRDWRDTTCIVQGVRSFEEKDSDGDVQKHVAVTFLVSQGGNSVTVQERDPEGVGHPPALRPQQTVPCRYDPANPTLATLEPNTFPWGLPLAALVPLSWLLIGLGGVLVNTPRGRLSAAGVPQELPVRLVPEVPPDKREFMADWGGILFGLVWNGFLTPMVLAAPRAIPFLSLHIGAGSLFTWAWTKPVLQRLRLGDAVVELSHEPEIGGSFDVKITQTGTSAVDSVVARLICEEVVTFTDGTTSRTERLQVHEQELGSAAFTRMQRHRPLVFRTQATIPSGAMHSFRSDHSAIEWSIVIEIQAPATPRREERFPLEIPVEIS